MHMAGDTLQAIGKRRGITREAVRQRIGPPKLAVLFHLSSEPGNSDAAKRAALAKLAPRLDEKQLDWIVSLLGCTNAGPRAVRECGLFPSGYKFWADFISHVNALQGADPLKKRRFRKLDTRRIVLDMDLLKRRR